MLRCSDRTFYTGILQAPCERRGGIKSIEECICSIDSPNNSPDCDVPPETGMRKHRDLSAKFHGTTEANGTIGLLPES
ncbi:unnamed protein product [Sphagnum compactum]